MNQIQEKEKSLQLDHIPILNVRGSHYEIGFMIGRTFRSMISELLEKWDYFNNELLSEYSKPRGQELYLNSLRLCNNKFPHYVEEIKGMAEGAAIDFYKLFLLNIDSIILANDEDREDFGQSVETGCTSIFCHKDEIVLGHTEDALSDIQHNVYVVSANITNEIGEIVEQFTTFSYAGHLLGYTMGFNAKGMVYSVNTIFPNVHTAGVPRAFIARALLNVSSLEETLNILRASGSGISDGLSLNLVFMDRTFETEEAKFYNIEISPPFKGETESHIDVISINPGESYVHSNKYLRIKTFECSTPILCSTRRHETMQFREINGMKDIKEILSDQSNTDYPIYICDRINTKMTFIKTVAVGIFDFKKKLLSIYKGKPSEAKPIAVIRMDLEYEYGG